MSEYDFVADERTLKQVGDPGLFRLNLRLFRSLPFFLKLFPLSLLAILLSSASPSVFRWYAGNLSSGTADGPVVFSLSGLISLALLAGFFRISAWALFELSGMWAARGLHARMAFGLSRTRTTYFDENPSGRLINRLIRDFDEVRSTAIIFVGDVLNASVEVLSIGVVAWLAHPLAALLLLPLLAAFFYIQGQRSAMLDHSRNLAAISTGQVLSRKNDLIEGREIFLLYGRGERLLNRMAASFGEYVRASMLLTQIETWGTFWIRISAEFFSLGVLCLLAFPLSRGEVSPALAGVIISSLFGITGSIGWLDFATGLVSRSLPHVRRVFEFIDLPREESQERAPGWNSVPCAPGLAPALALVDYRMSYRADSPVILGPEKGLALDFPKGSKTALIGRTGSGKTSTFQALLRMVHVRQGEVRIAGRSAFEVEIDEYRRLFGVVPQAPYLFAGTIRSNLDRLGKIPQLELEAVLSAVGLKFGLDHAVLEGGQNLSVGERQLVCLARVIAAKRPFILMDEPTSGLDPKTDARISQLLGSALADKTVITIAHRLESLKDYDRVVELSAGQVVWQGQPGGRAFRASDADLFQT